MKEVSPELEEYLHTRKHFFMCDLYEITLQSGLVFRYANYAMPITVDGKVFTHKGPIFERERTKLTSTITVDKMNITVYVDQSDKIGGAAALHVAHNGGFDEAWLSLYRCFMSEPGVVVGTLEMFSGDINVKNGGGLEMDLEVKSAVQRLNVEWPSRKYYPTCPYALYGVACGVNISDYTVTGAVTSVSNQIEFTTNLSFANGYYDQGGIEWLTGPLSGACAPVKTSESGKLILLIPLEAAPEVGNTFHIYPGCDKTAVTCRNKFNNFLRNRATPYIPLKEAIV